MRATTNVQGIQSTQSGNQAGYRDSKDSVFDREIDRYRVVVFIIVRVISLRLVLIRERDIFSKTIPTRESSIQQDLVGQPIKTVAIYQSLGIVQKVKIDMIHHYIK